MSERKEPTLRNVMGQLKLIKGQLKQQKTHAELVWYYAGITIGFSIMAGATFAWLSKMSGLDFLIGYASFILIGAGFGAWSCYRLVKIDDLSKKSKRILTVMLVMLLVFSPLCVAKLFLDFFEIL